MLNYEFKNWKEVFSYFDDPYTIILQLNKYFPLLPGQDQVHDYYNKPLVNEQQILKTVDWGDYAETILKDSFFQKNHSNLNDSSLTVINFDLFDRIANLLREYGEEEKKIDGIVYTPYYLAEQITQRTIGQWWKINSQIGTRKKQNQKIYLLDPTVGTGTFLIAAGNILYDIFRKKDPYSSSLNLRKRIIEHNLHGFDKDPIGIFITKIKLRLWILEDWMSEVEPYGDLADNIYLGDSLFGYNDRENHLLSSSKSKAKPRKEHSSAIDRKIGVYKLPSKSSFYEKTLIINDYYRKFCKDINAYYFIIEGTKREWNECKNYLEEDIRKKVHFSESDYFNPSNDTYIIFPDEIQQKNENLTGDLTPWCFPGSDHIKEPEIPPEFHIIIGNPPFIALTDLSMVTRLKIKEIHPEIYNGNSDLSYFFTKGMMQNLSPYGVLGFLLSKSILSSVYAKQIREFIIRKATLLEIHDFNELLIFPQINIKTCFMLLINKKWTSNEELHAYKYSKTKFEDIEATKISQIRLKSEKWTLYSLDTKKTIEKIIRISNCRLNEISSLSKGIETGCDKVFAPKVPYFFSMHLHLKSSHYKPWLKGGEIKPFFIKREGMEVLYAPKFRQEQIRNSKNAYQYLKDNKDDLLNRSRVTKYYLWREGDERNTMDWQGVKIVTPYKARRNTFAIDDQGCLSSKDVVWIIPNEDYNDANTLLFLVALLNSKTLTFYARCMFKDLGGMYDYYPLQIRNLPLVLPPRDSQKYIDIVTVTRQIQNSPSEKKHILVEEIDRVIYQLYNLTKKEISEIESFLNQ